MMLKEITSIEHISDIYKPVNESEIEYVESILRGKFPESLKEIYCNPNFELFDKIATFLWFIEHPTLGIKNVNLDLRDDSYFNQFPDFLIAFCTNECGDYWCIDTRNNSILYIDPDNTIHENLERDALKFRSFNDFFIYKQKPSK